MHAGLGVFRTDIIRICLPPLRPRVFVYNCLAPAAWTDGICCVFFSFQKYNTMLHFLCTRCPPDIESTQNTRSAAHIRRYPAARLFVMEELKKGKWAVSSQLNMGTTTVSIGRGHEES